MTTRDQTGAVLELVASREPISGHLRDEAGAVRCFHGWLELAALLDAAHHQRPEPIADTTDNNRIAGSPRAMDDHLGPREPSRRHRAALVTWLGIWPLVSVALWLVAPRLGTFPFLVRTALIAALVVAAMTYLVMPGFARFGRTWQTHRRHLRIAQPEGIRR
jgi:antibiotic biosynthesis monooxygenase (ABM) superfamily enzyme